MGLQLYASDVTHYKTQVTTAVQSVSTLWFPVFMASLWMFAYVLFPSWLLPVSGGLRITIAGLLFVYVAVNSAFVFRWFSSADTKKHGKAQPLRDYLPLAIFSTFISALHIYPVRFALWDIDDEAYHMANPLTLSGKISETLAPILPVDMLSVIRVLVLASVVAGVFMMLTKRRTMQTDRVRMANSVKLVAFSVFSVAVLIYAYLLKDMAYMGGLFRFPVLSRLFYLVCYSVFGINEFAPRLLQLVFSIGSAFILFRIVEVYKGKDTAFLSAAFFLVFPNTFYFGSVGEMASGVIFFILLSVYFFMNHLREGYLEDLMICAAVFTVGFFYKREIAVLLPVFLMMLFLKRGHLSQKKSVYFKWSWVLICGITPFVLHGKMLGLNQYLLMPANWLHLSVAGKYLFQVPAQITYYGFALLMIGLFRLITKKKDALDLMIIVYLIISYSYLTSDSRAFISEIGHLRVSYIFYPFIAVLIAQAFSYMPRVKAYVYAVPFLSLMLLSATVMDTPALAERYTVYKNADNSIYNQYDELVMYIRDDVAADGLIYDAMQPEFFKFYLYKYKVNIDRFYRGQLPVDVSADVFGSHNIKYFITQKPLRDGSMKLLRMFRGKEHVLFLWEVSKG